MRAKGKVKQIKIAGERRAILLDSDERWFSIFNNTKGFDEAPSIVAKIDEHLSKGDYVSMEVIKNKGGFWNIRGLDIEKDINEDMQEKLEDKVLYPEQWQENWEEAHTGEKFTKKPQKSKNKDIDTVQMFIMAQSARRDAIATVAQYDLGGMKEKIDEEINRVWGEYFQRVIKLA